MTPGTSSLRPLTVLQECHKLLMDSGLKETGEADDDGRESQGQKPAPTLVSLAELPSNGAASARRLPLPTAARATPRASLRPGGLPTGPAGRRSAPTDGGSAGAGAGRMTDPIQDRSHERHDLEPRPARGPHRPDAETALPPDGRTVPPLGANSSTPPPRRACPHPLPMGWDDRRTGSGRRHLPRL